MKTTKITISVRHYDDRELEELIESALNKIKNGYIVGYLERFPIGIKPFTENVSFEFSVQIIKDKE